MSDSKPPAQGASPRQDEWMSALFGQMVMQQHNMALMLLGKVPHPETGKTIKDLEAARLFIDQLEILEVKTKGNLTAQESSLLKQSLMNLRLSFVEAVEPAPSGNPLESASAPPPDEPQESAEPTAAPAPPPAPATAETHKKFSKKY